METSQSMNKIVGGEKAPTPIPWQVHVHITPYNLCRPRNGTCSCGGTILDETTILSAAHCFPLDPPFPTSTDYIQAGIKVRASLDGQKIFVKDVIIHPMFNPMKSSNKDNDIAILKLWSPLTFNEHVQPACLPYPSVMPENTGMLAVTSGWGLTSEGNGLAFSALIVVSAAKYLF